MHLSEFDKLSNLTMRADIESKIENVITKCGFSRLELKQQDNNNPSKEEKTIWNRTLHLYKRND